MGNNLNNVISVLIDFHCKLDDCYVHGGIDLEVLEIVVDDLKEIKVKNYEDKKALREQIAALREQISKNDLEWALHHD